MPRTSLASKSHHINSKPYKRAKNTEITQTEISSTEDAIILLVDDDPAVLEGLKRVLVMEGWQVVTASNGEEALEHLAEAQPDLMITDLCMFGVSGWDLLFHERMQRPNLPIFVITALPLTSVDGANRFASGFFQKPLDLEVMVAEIRRHFRESKVALPCER